MIQKYTKKDGSTAYLIKVYLGVDAVTGKQLRTTRRGFKTEREAKLAEAKLLTELDLENLTRVPEQMTFQQVHDLWLDQYKNTVKESTFFVQQNALNLHILPVFGKLRIDKITIMYCQKQVNNWYSYYAKYSNLIGLTQRILDYAISLGLIKDNPMKKTMKPKRKKQVVASADQKEKNFYNKEELQHFLSCLENEPKETKLIFRLLAFTGLRKSELLALQWSDINFDTMQLSVTKTLARGNGGRLIVQTPKTAKSERTISLDQQSVNLLSEWKIFRMEFFMKKGFRKVSPHAKEFVFVDDLGDLYDIDYPNRLLNDLIKKYNLKKITPHGFRDRKSVV